MEENKRTKSITLIAGNYPAPGHVALVFVQQLVHAIIDMGVKVTVIARQSIVHSVVHKQKLLPKHSVGKTDLGKEYNIYRPFTLSFGNTKIGILKRFSSWYNKYAITRKVKKIKSDIIYTHFWSSALPICKYASKNNIPLFVACGEGDNALEDMVKSMSKDKLNLLFNSVSGVISVSTENKRKCIDFGLVKEDNIQTIPNCVNTAIFHKKDVKDFKKQIGIEENDFVISFVGGFIPRKGPDRIAKAISILNDPSIKVMFIGKPFPGYSYDFNCPGIIHKGPLDHNLLPKYVNCSDIFVMPTQKEGCCNAIVEALAMGLPVISSDGPFNDDILDDKNSIRIDPNNIEEIALAIKKLKDNPNLRKQMSEYSLSRHEEYSITGRAKRILEFIESKL